MTMSTSCTLGLVASIGILFLVAGCASTKATEETAPFTSVKTEGTFEIRSYPEIKIASTSDKEGEASRDQRFMKLFGYIQGKNKGEQKIEMTTPVFMEGKDMIFVMPKAVAEKGAPESTNPDVKVGTIPARKVAVYRYSGWSNAKVEEESIEKLKAWIKDQKLEAIGEPSKAFYNPPWTLGPMRRNEILIPIK